MKNRRDALIGGLCLIGGLAVVALGLALFRSSGHSDAKTPDGRVILRFTAWGGGREIGELREKVLARVNGNACGYFVKLEPIPSEYPLKLATMVAGRRAPDIFYLDPSYFAHYAARGALLDITSRVAADSDPVCDVEDYYPRIIRNYYWKGALYGLPWIAQPVVLYCNRELFGKAGVALPDESWNRGAFLKAALRLREAGAAVDPPWWAFVMEPGWPPLEMFVWQNGADFLDGRGRVAVADPRVLEAAGFWRDLLHRYRVAPPLDLVTERGLSNLFRDGRVAMFAGGAADDLDETPGLSVAVRPFPSGPSGKRAPFAWNAGLHVSARTAHPDLAFAAFKAILDGIHHWKIAPPRKSLAAKIGEIAPAKRAAADTIRRSLTHMRPLRSLRERKAWDDIFYRRFKEPLLREGADPAELAKDLAPLLENLLFEEEN